MTENIPEHQSTGSWIMHSCEKTKKVTAVICLTHQYALISMSFGVFNPLTGRGVNWLHFAIQV